MRKFILLAAVASLAACSQGETAPEAEATPEAVATEAASTAADGGPSTGKYEVTNADGGKVVVDVMEDGTYSVAGEDGAVVDTGTWTQPSPEKYCEVSSAEGATEICYDETVDENGVYTSTNPNTGEVSTVVRLDS